MEEPAKARMKGLAMVPMASRPIFMPERKSCPAESSGLSVWSPWEAEAMDMATSITAAQGGDEDAADKQTADGQAPVPWHGE